MPIAENLAALRTLLLAGDLGAPVADRLSLLATLLSEQGDALPSR